MTRDVIRLVLLMAVLLVITALTTVISVPIGLLTAIYLVEYGSGRLKKAITFLVDVMTGIPSIVAGLFAIALFTLFFRFWGGWGRPNRSWQ